MDSTFFTIGDITNDAFITLKEAAVHCDLSTEACTISMRWGDKIPYEAVEVVSAVGNSVNAAIAARRLGLPTSCISFIGADKHGEECQAVLKDEGVDTTYLSVQPGKSTNYHYVLSYEAERTILVRHEAFDYHFPDLPETIEWLYLSSVGEAAEPLHDTIAAWLTKHPQVRLVFQPGTFQMKLGYERLQALYQQSSLFVCNKQEAQRILTSNETDIRTLIKELHAKGPAVVSLTDGVNGAYLFDGATLFFVPQYPDLAPPKERTGAGDAFTSALAAFLAKGYSPRDALLRAPINSMSVVQHVGARKGLLSEEDIEHYLAIAPPEYTLSLL